MSSLETFIKKKLDIVEDQAKMYKMVGPTMIPLKKDEIKSEVEGRLDLLKKRMLAY